VSEKWEWLIESHGGKHKTKWLLGSDEESVLLKVEEPLFNLSEEKMIMIAAAPEMASEIEHLREINASLAEAAKIGLEYIKHTSHKCSIIGPPGNNGCLRCHLDSTNRKKVEAALELQGKEVDA